MTLRLLLPREDFSERATENVRLRVLSDAAGLKHLSVSIDLPIEFLDLATEDVGPEHQFLKRAHTRFRSVRTNDTRPLEDLFEHLIVFLQLDECGPG